MRCLLGLFLFASASGAVLVTHPTRTRVQTGVLHNSFVREGSWPGYGTRLTVGEVVDANITRDEVQAFTAQLERDTFAYIRFDWQGSDLSVNLVGPSGEKLQTNPSTVVAPGPITIIVYAVAAGEYKLIVGPRFSQKISGTFRIKLEAIRASNSTDQSKLNAQQLLAEGLAKGNTPEAIAKIEQAVQIWQTLQDRNAEAQALLALADAYRAARQNPQAKTTYERAIETFRTNNDLRGQAYSLISLGNFVRNTGTPTGGAKDALPFYEQARDLFTSVGDQRGLGSALYNMGFALMRIGRTPEGLSVLQNALDVRRTLNDRVGLILTLNIMADGYRMLGDFEQSLDLYREANQTIVGLEYTSMEATLSNGIALVYDDWGDWQRAQEGYLRALAIQESLLGPTGLDNCSPKPANPTICRSAAFALDNMAETFNSLGDYDKALAQLNRALPIRVALAEPAGLGNTHFHLGYTQYLLGNFPIALDHYSRALESLEKAGDDKIRSLTYTYMGMVHISQNQPDRALELYLKALPGLVKSRDKRAQAITTDKIATAYANLQKWDDARKSFADALALWRSVKDPDGEALTLYNMARAERDVGNLKVANQHSEAAISLVENLRTKVSNERLRASYLAKFENYYELDIDLKMQIAKKEGRADLIAAALESAEKSRARVLLDTLSEAGVGRTEASANEDPQLVSLRRDRQESLIRLAARERARTNLLSGSPTPEQIAALDREISKLTEKYDSVEARIKSLDPRFASLTKPQPSTLKQIQEQLDNETLVLEYALGEDRSYVWTVSSQSVAGYELPRKSEIEALAKRVYQALAVRGEQRRKEQPEDRSERVRKAEANFDQASAQLSDIILRPIAAGLGNKRLVVIADGPMQTLPFAALPNPPNGDRMSPQVKPTALIETNEVISLPSASVLVLQRNQLARRTPAPLKVAVIADPVFERNDPRVADALARRKSPDKDSAESSSTARKPNRQNALALNSSTNRALSDLGFDSPGEIQRLLFSHQEANAILQLVPRNQSFQAFDFKANRSTVLGRELSRYRIVHLATHGIMNLNHPELSGVLLSMVDEQGQPQNGFLGLSEIYSLNLPADLVVLSACETGIGKEVKGEGLIALTRGFMYAGAERVVASLWKVDDVATSELMAAFYREMLVNKLKPAAALRNAQRKLANTKRWQNPHYWAGFVLLGEWR